MSSTREGIAIVSANACKRLGSELSRDAFRMLLTDGVLGWAEQRTDSVGKLPRRFDKTSLYLEEWSVFEKLMCHICPII